MRPVKIDHSLQTKLFLLRLKRSSFSTMKQLTLLLGRRAIISVCEYCDLYGIELFVLKLSGASVQEIKDATSCLHLFQTLPNLVINKDVSLKIERERTTKKVIQKERERHRK